MTTAGNPLTSFADDVAAAKRAIAAQDGPTVLVGHSYGGVVITEAGNDPKVVSLVYVAAFAPDAGQSIGEISQAFAKPAGADQVQPQPNGFLLLSQKGIEEDFAQDLTPAEKAHLVAAQPKTSGAIFEAKPTAAAWRAQAGVVRRVQQRPHDRSRAGKEHGEADQGQGHGTAVEPCRDVVASGRRRESHRRSGCQRTSSMTVEDVIRTHTEGFNRALTTHDLDALSAIYADDYMLVRPDGSVLGKEDVLRDLGAGGLRFTSIELANVSVRIYDQTALLTGESRTVSSRNGDEMSAHIRLLAVYVHDRSRLRLAHFQSASLPA